jgi:hypothetical protein
MSQSLNLKIKGLFTSFNEFSEAPEGALLVADNIDILQESIAQPRRGFDRETSGYSDTSDRTDAIAEYDDKIIAHHGSTVGSADTLSYYSSGTWTSIGAFAAPTSWRMKFAAVNQNLYYTTNAGIYKLDAYNATAVKAGAYKGLDLVGSNSVSGSGWLANNSSVAYRVVWGYRDDNDNLVLGAPSQREEYTNTSGSSANVSITTTIPAGVTTSWFVQLYRSAAVTSGTPSEELGLVYETNPVSADITAKTITIVDIVPDALRGATIYTAASQEGLANGNEQPPLAKDVAVFRDCVFYLNTTSKHRFNLTLIAVGGSNGVANDDTISIGGVTYTGKGTETIASAQFQVVTGGSAASNITDTAQSLVRVINRYSSSTVYAYYLSGVDDLPGMILLEERSIGGAAFVITASKPASWNPTDIPTSGTTKTSSNDAFVNGISWSKPSQPEAVPLPNFAFVGSRNLAALRVIALRDAMYIFKEGEGIYKLSGYYPNFQIDKVDDSANLIAKESCQVLNSQIFCLTDQGVTVVTDSTKVLSLPIEQELRSLVNQNLSLVESIAFGVAYESDRKYYLFLPSSASDTYATQAYVYNLFTNSWVRHVLNATAGFVSDANDYYLGHGISNYLLKERKNYSFLDFVDFGFTTTLTASSSRVMAIDSGFDNVAVGDILWQSNTLFATVTALDVLAQTFTVGSDPGFTLAACTLLKAISVELTWAPVTLANPGIQKQLHTTLLLFKEDFTGQGELGFTSDVSQFEDSVSIEGRGLALWGLFGWGELPWGGTALRRPLRQWIPRAKQRASQLTVTFRHAFGYSPWQLQGLSLFGAPGSEKIGRV